MPNISNRPTIVHRLNHGDMKTIAEITGASYSLVEKVMRGVLPVGNVATRKKIIEAANRLVSTRRTIQKELNQ